MLNIYRCKQLVQKAIDKFNLDLGGNIVLTEAATGYYILTPLIAAMGGADAVYAITADSRYGTASMVKEETMALADLWDMSDIISVFTSQADSRVGEADIVTNLGFVRPMDRSFLKRLKPTAVIPLMWETWEFRPEELDLTACHDLDIAVLGTNEHHPNLNTFEYIGSIALKLLLSKDIEIIGSKVAVMGSGEFADIIVNKLKLSGSETMLIDSKAEDILANLTYRQFFRSADALIIAEHNHRKQLIGLNGGIPPQKLVNLNPGICIAHICGNVDRKALDKAEILYCPENFAPPGFMSIATDFVGPKALIDLHAAGLKIGERLTHFRQMGLSAFDAEMAVIEETELSQGFSGYHKKG